MHGPYNAFWNTYVEVPYDWLQATLHVTRKCTKLGKDKNLAPVVQKVDNAIHWIAQFSFPNNHALDSAIQLLNKWCLNITY